jgi:uncharacterized protein
MERTRITIIAVILIAIATIPAFLVPKPNSGATGLEAAEKSEPGELKPIELAKDPGTRVLKWEDLVPPGYSADELMDSYMKKVEGISDTDPRAKQAVEQLRAMWTKAPLVESLNGKRVKLPGYIVPLEGDGKAVSEFLLVPFFGACIHVPPPPANQIVYVKTKAAKVREMFDIVWVTGTLRTERQSNDLADAGYTLEATDVAPYR